MIVPFVILLAAFALLVVAFRKQQRATEIYRRRFREGVTLIEQMDANRRELEAVNADLAMQAELLIGELKQRDEEYIGHIVRRERTIDEARDVAARMSQQLEQYREAERVHREELIEQRRGELVNRLKRAGHWRGATS